MKNSQRLRRKRKGSEDKEEVKIRQKIHIRSSAGSHDDDDDGLDSTPMNASVDILEEETK